VKRLLKQAIDQLNGLLSNKFRLMPVDNQHRNRGRNGRVNTCTARGIDKGCLPFIPSSMAVFLFNQF